MTAWVKYRKRETSVSTMDTPAFLPERRGHDISEMVLVSHHVGGEPHVSEGYLAFKLHDIGADAWYIIGTPYPIKAMAWMIKPLPFDGDGYLD